VLAQHSMELDRVVNQATMRGTVSGTLGASGPDSHFGRLHGIVNPEGMRGTIVMTRFREDGATDKFVGSWTASGHLVEQGGITFCFKGRFIVSP
jgi:hypothetical protein